MASFEVHHTRFVEADGTTTGPLPEWADDRDEVVALYRAMALTRAFDARAVALQRTGQLGTFASSLGQEAVAVGVASAMEARDVLVPSFREQGAQLWRGVTMPELLLYWGGDERGSDFAGPREDFPISVPVGSHAPHAAGVAMAMRLGGEDRVAVCVIGDGATSKGDVHEALNFAALHRLPAVFVVNDNQWAISVPRTAQTAAATLAQKAIAAGIDGEQVDGNDVVAVRERVGAAVARARSGGGPAFVEALTYRLSDHTTADDARRYRDDAEVAAAWAREPMARLRGLMVARGWWGRDDEEAVVAQCREAVEAAVEEYLAVPALPATAMFDHLHAVLPAVWAPQREEVARRHPDAGAPPAATGPTGAAASPASGAPAEPGSPAGGPGPSPEVAELTMVEAVRTALGRAMADDGTVLLLGEDVGADGGVFRATEGLLDRFGPDRVVDTPISEALFVGLAVGLAAQGLRPVVEYQFLGFAYPGLDQLVNHASRLRNRTRGRLSCPMVVRSVWGGGIGAPEHHSESTEALFAHVPGLRVVMPSSPARAYGLLLAAIADPDPVVFLEPARRYRSGREPVVDDGTPLPLDRCAVLRPGTDLTLVSWGATVGEALAAADELAASDGVDAEVIDLSTLRPLDAAGILDSVARTGRCVVVHEAVRSGGLGAEVAAVLADEGLTSLLAPVVRVTGWDTVIPLSRLEQAWLPGVDRIVAAARRVVEFS